MSDGNGAFKGWVVKEGTNEGGDHHPEPRDTPTAGQTTKAASTKPPRKTPRENQRPNDCQPRRTGESLRTFSRATVENGRQWFFGTHPKRDCAVGGYLHTGRGSPPFLMDVCGVSPYYILYIYDIMGSSKHTEKFNDDHASTLKTRHTIPPAKRIRWNKTRRAIGTSAEPCETGNHR